MLARICLNGLCNTAASYLSIQVVIKSSQELALNGLLLRHQGQIVMVGDDCPLAKLVKLRPTSSTKDLHHIQDAQVHKCPLLGVIDLSAL